MDGSKSKTKRATAASLKAIVFIVVVVLDHVITGLAFENVLEKAKIDGIDNHDVDIFVEKKIRFLHAKIDLKPAINGLITLEKCVSQLAKSSADSLDLTLSKNLEKRVRRIVAGLSRLTGKDYLNSRDKRSIEFIGNLISDIFGNPGPADWKKVNANLLALQAALKRIDENVAIDHSDIDTNRHVIEKHNNEIRLLSKLVNRNQNELTNINSELKGLHIFLEISTLADTVDSIVSALLEIKTEGTKGYCSDRALDKDFLIENIQTMEANKAGISPIFGSWEWRNYYKYEMCSLAMVDEALWITIRIPLIKRSERLTRVIPPAPMKRLIDRIGMYGVNVLTFRERDNDKYHLMSQSTFDMCNVLGNSRTCSTRDYRFNGLSLAIPVEFMMDRFMIVSDKLASIKITEKCPNVVREIIVALDTVILAPVNCSYLSNSFSIDVRENNVEITKEVGIISIDKLEINKIENYHANMSEMFVAAIVNKSSSDSFDRNRVEINDKLNRNRAEIHDKLNSIDVKHENLWQTYNVEKWIFGGALIAFFLVFTVLKCRSTIVSKSVRTTTFNEIEELRASLSRTQNELRQDTLSLQEVRISSQRITEVNDTEEASSTAMNNELGTSTFRSPLHRSQFVINKN